MRTKIRLGGGYKSYLTIFRGTAILLSAFLLSYIFTSILSPVQNGSAIDCTNGTISSGSASDICGTDTTDVNVSIEGAWTVSVSSSGTLGLNLTPNSSGILSTVTDNVNVYTNTPNGYQLYLNSTSGSTDIYNNNVLDQNGNLANNLPSGTNTNHFVATSGTKASPSTLTNNTWGYSLSSSPTTFSKVELTSTSLDSLISTGSKTTGAGDNLPVTYGFMADTKLTPGTYSTQVTYTAIAEVPSYSLSSLSPSQIALGDQTDKTFTILTTVPASELGLGDITAKFVWNDGTTTHQANLSNCTEITQAVSGTNYRGASCSYTGNLPLGIYNVELTSSWHNATYILNNALEIYTNMQSFTATQCTNLAESTTTLDNRITLKDSRDGKDYKVSKLADGNCWMVSNLALDGGRTLHTSDSNVTQDRILPANISNGTASDWDTAQIYSGNANSTTTDCGSYAYCVLSDIKYGNLYNWNAATATVGKQATTSTVTESVCPKGWQLPNNTGTKSFNGLMAAYPNLPTTDGTDGTAVQTIQQAPFNFPLAGYYTNSSVHQAHRATYWSRTIYTSNTNRTYDLGLDSENGGLYPQDNNYKYYGSSVRCVFGS
ncbi:hypothetical protein IKG54_00800 [Candidatus Saccharibacteria bacterium]|nr:hypothetical protein [Candidatus Saccharibacteria bacterium]